MQLGQELHLRCRNDEAIQINNGQLVYVSGGQNDRPLIMLANNSNITTMATIGFATEDIPAGQLGYVTIYGLVRDVDTSLASPGDTLWLDNVDGMWTTTRPLAPKFNVDGMWTTTRPLAPKFNVVVGICIRAHGTEGVILAKIDIVPRMRGLSDVRITNPQDNDVIQYDSTGGYWFNTTGSGGGSGTSGTSGTSGSSGTSGTGGAFTTQEKDNLELQMAYDASYRYNTKLFTYTGTDLTQIDITDGTNVLFTKVLSYNVQGLLITSVLTRLSDSADF